MPEHDPSERQSNMSRNIKVGAVVGLLVIALVAYANFGRTDGGTAESDVATTDASGTPVPTATATPQASPSAGAATDGQAAQSSEYKDGTYTATGTYRTPGGAESIGVSLTIKNDVVTGTSLTQTTTDRESGEYQRKFASGYESLVVGKKLDELSLSRVSGSSLTSTGFNNAVMQIKSQADAS